MLCCGSVRKGRQNEGRGSGEAEGSGEGLLREAFVLFGHFLRGQARHISGKCNPGLVYAGKWQGFMLGRWAASDSIELASIFCSIQPLVYFSEHRT